MNQVIVQIEHLSHRYGQRLALDDVSLNVEDGQILGLLGPNGSGKTTLFRVLSTLLPVQAGKVCVLGMDLASSSMRVRSLIGVVFQSPSLDRHLTVEENLRHHGHLYGLLGAALSARIDDMLRRFELADRRRELVQSLSGGMRRRVELAKALLTRPRILIMDEPSTGLDPSARIDMWQALGHVRRQDGVSILLTTHLMDDAERCENLAILDNGRLAAQGSPSQLKQLIGGDVITLTSRDPAGVCAALRERLNVAAEQVEQTVRIERPRAHEFVPQLVEALPGLVESVSIGKPTLEDVFIHVTGHRFNALD